MMRERNLGEISSFAGLDMANRADGCGKGTRGNGAMMAEKTLEGLNAGGKDTWKEMGQGPGERAFG